MYDYYFHPLGWLCHQATGNSDTEWHLERATNGWGRKHTAAHTLLTRPFPVPMQGASTSRDSCLGRFRQRTVCTTQAPLRERERCAGGNLYLGQESKKRQRSQRRGSKIFLESYIFLFHLDPLPAWDAEVHSIGVWQQQLL